MTGLRPGIVGLAITLFCTGCSSDRSPASPTAPISTVSTLPIGFDGAGPHAAPVSSFTARGFTVTATTTNWTVSTNYGRPAPFIQFMAPAGTTELGELLITTAGGAFRFVSVDVYSSTTTIPYVITGLAGSATVFTIQNTQPNTFGNFATVVNPDASRQVDALVIRLSNPAAACCSNPMGLDNIVLAR